MPSGRGSTITCETVYTIDASPVIGARIGRAVIDIRIAVDPFPTVIAGTLICPRPGVCTGAVYTRVVTAVDHFNLAIVSSVACQARATIRVDPVGTSPPVLAGVGVAIIDIGLTIGAFVAVGAGAGVFTGVAHFATAAVLTRVRVA